MKKSLISYFIIIFSLIVIASLGSVFVNLGMDYFKSLIKPSQFIPDIIIPIAWTIIYILFGVVLCKWNKEDEFSSLDLFLLIINGILNIVWCFVFFTCHLTYLGLIIIVFNLILSYLLINKIYFYNKLYGCILSIYPIWLSFAVCLNLSLWVLN